MVYSIYDISEALDMSGGMYVWLYTSSTDRSRSTTYLQMILSIKLNKICELNSILTIFLLEIIVD